MSGPARVARGAAPLAAEAEVGAGWAQQQAAGGEHAEEGPRQADLRRQRGETRATCAAIIDTCGVIICTYAAIIDTCFSAGPSPDRSQGAVR